MRKVVNPQMKIGEVDISKIEFDLRSRDEIPKILMGLQHIYCSVKIREEVFEILEEMIPEGTDKKNGRQGMELWKILVLGTIRINCNFDYDRLKELANEHKTLRQMLGHGMWEDDYKYALQTLKDNVSLLTPEILEKLNKVVVKAGHNLVNKKKEEKLNGRCDSFVVETKVHYPTDISLLFDAIRVMMILISQIAGIVGWRQRWHNIKKIKRLCRRIQNLKRSTSGEEEKRRAKEEEIMEAHREYIEMGEEMIKRAKNSIGKIKDRESKTRKKLEKIEERIKDAEKQIEQIRRRVIEKENIPHGEKIFSIFEKHTEWICKGKAGISQELGLRVSILEDQYGFILHHMVMEKETDDKVAVTMVRKTKSKFSELWSCSFDKGFYSLMNKNELEKILDKVILPKKGKLSLKDKEEENTEEFIQLRKKHSAVESAINALENHGLDRCLDSGMSGFKRYVALAVTARNIQILGDIIQQNRIRHRIRCEKYRKTKDKNFQLAA